ncbi:hypothetical protein V1514DRAFT_87577 [Lipomyces japonicus]|uniref:uncharacterized protein n=1 Tax=Lipomyces japonicus TaxID=56871 RepID=UPI0034CE2416
MAILLFVPESSFGHWPPTWPTVSLSSTLYQIRGFKRLRSKFRPRQCFIVPVTATEDDGAAHVVTGRLLRVTQEQDLSMLDAWFEDGKTVLRMPCTATSVGTTSSLPAIHAYTYLFHGNSILGEFEFANQLSSSS